MSTQRVLALAATGLALAVILTACANNDISQDGMTDGMSNAADSDGRTADIAFAQLMIAHHQQAIEMADLALTRATNSDVKNLAEQIKSAQDPEITEMKDWLSTWNASEEMTGMDGGMDHSGHDMGGMAMAGMMNAKEMRSLAQASGADFDRMWLQMMIAHHQGAIAMANQVLASTSDPDVQSLAEAVVAGQTAEISTMRALLAP